MNRMQELENKEILTPSELQEYKDLMTTKNAQNKSAESHHIGWCDICKSYCYGDCKWLN